MLAILLRKGKKSKLREKHNYLLIACLHDVTHPEDITSPPSEQTGNDEIQSSLTFDPMKTTALHVFVSLVGQYNCEVLGARP